MTPRPASRMEKAYLDIGLTVGFVSGALVVGLLWWVS